MDRILLPQMVHSIRCLSHQFDCDPTRLLPTSNATTALNAAVGIARRATDLIAVVRPGYGSNIRIASAVSDASGASLATIQIPNAVRRVADTSQLGEVLEEQLRSSKQATKSERIVLLVEHIVSHDGLMLPVKELHARLRAVDPNGVMIVDGAHTPGAVNSRRLPLDAEPNVLFAANLHKWFCAARGCGFLRVPTHTADKDNALGLQLAAPVTSHGRDAGLLSNFVWDGNRDYSPFLSLPLVCKFWHDIDETRVHAYQQALMQQVDSLLCNTTFGWKPYCGECGGVIFFKRNTFLPCRESCR